MKNNGMSSCSSVSVSKDSDEISFFQATLKCHPNCQLNHATILKADKNVRVAYMVPPHFCFELMN
jgi:hypothetical protein